MMGQTQQLMKQKSKHKFVSIQFYFVVLVWQMLTQNKKWAFVKII